MAFNQVSLSFYAPRWRQRLTPTDARTVWGAPLMLAGAVPAENADAPPVDPVAVKGWLRERGFTAVDWAPETALQRGRVSGAFGPTQEIIIHVHDEAGEVESLYCRFTLVRRNLPPLAEWTDLMTALCSRFGFRLGAEGTDPCCAQEFLSAVLGNHNYQDFARAFGWPGGGDQPPGAG